MSLVDDLVRRSFKPVRTSAPDERERIRAGIERQNAAFRAARALPPGRKPAPEPTPASPFVPVARPDLALVDIAPPVFASEAKARVWKSSCKERCGDTGHACAIPAPHPGQPHGDARGPFRRLAVLGQTRFLRDEVLEVHASARHDHSTDSARAGGNNASKQAARARYEAKRKSNTNQETNDV